MKKWEYKLIDSTQTGGSSREALEKYLDTLGDEGWEVVGFQVSNIWRANFNGIAKREKQA